MVGAFLVLGRLFSHCLSSQQSSRGLTFRNMGGRVKSNEREHALTDPNHKGGSVVPATVIVPFYKDRSTSLLVVASCQDSDGGHDESDACQPETGDLRPWQLFGKQSDQCHGEESQGNVDEVDLPLRGQEVRVVDSSHGGEGLCAEDARTGREHPPGKDAHPADCVRHCCFESCGGDHEGEAKGQVNHGINHPRGAHTGIVHPTSERHWPTRQDQV